MKLIHQGTNKEAKISDKVTDFRGEDTGTITYFSKPHKPSSSGRVTVTLDNGHAVEHYVSVWGLEWIEREDR